MAKTAQKQRERKLADVEKRIVGVEETDIFLKMLLYARNGQGKTRIAATGPKCLIIDINEKGTLSVRNYPGVKVFHAKTWEDLTYIYWFLRDGDHDFETVVLDTMTGMQNMAMKHVLKEAEDRDPNRDPKTASQREWGKMAEYMKPLILNFRNLPMHVIFTAQIRNGKNRDDADAMDEWVPDLSPNPRAQLTAAVDVIGFVFQREVRAVKKKGKAKKTENKWETRMLVGPHDEYITKDRTGVLPRVVRNPTVPKIIEAAAVAVAEES